MFDKNRIKIQKCLHTNGFPYYSGNIRSTGRRAGAGGEVNVRAAGIQTKDRAAVHP